MRISDWSSDVCSSDLAGADRPAAACLRPADEPEPSDFLGSCQAEATRLRRKGMEGNTEQGGGEYTGGFEIDGQPRSVAKYDPAEAVSGHMDPLPDRQHDLGMQPLFERRPCVAREPANRLRRIPPAGRRVSGAFGRRGETRLAARAEHRRVGPRCV